MFRQITNKCISFFPITQAHLAFLVNQERMVILAQLEHPATPVALDQLDLKVSPVHPATTADQAQLDLLDPLAQ